MTRLALTLSVLLAVPAVAVAQDDPIPADGDPLGEGAGDPVPLEDDDAGDVVPLGDDDDAPAGSEEDPDAPTPTGDEDEGRGNAETGYPTNVVRRPITLGQNMAQVSYTIGIGGLTDKIAYRRREDTEPFRAGGWLTAEYGITNRIQLGLLYGTGTYGQALADGDKGYEAGKAFSVQLVYLLQDWVGIQLEVPFLVEPRNVGVTLGAPMKFRFTDKFALFFGEDLVTFRVTGLVPFPEDSVSNASAVDAHDERGADQDDGDITIKGGAIVALGDKLTFKGTFGVVAADFQQTDAGSPLWADFIYVASKRFDLAARVGFANLAEASDTVTVQATAAFRL